MLPLITVNSVTCDTLADAEARIANTGAKGGVNGKRDLEERKVEARCAPISLLLWFHRQPGLYGVDICC